MADSLFKKVKRWVGIGIVAGGVAIGATASAPAQDFSRAETLSQTSATVKADSLKDSINKLMTVIARLISERKYKNVFEVTQQAKYSGEMIRNNEIDNTRKMQAIMLIESIIKEDIRTLKIMFSDMTELNNSKKFQEAYDLCAQIKYYAGTTEHDAGTNDFKDLANEASKLGSAAQKELHNKDKLRFVQNQGVVDYTLKMFVHKDKKYLQLKGVCSDPKTAEKRIKEIMEAELKQRGANPNAAISINPGKTKNGMIEITGFTEITNQSQAQNIINK